MSLDDIIASYIEQQRCLGKRFSREAIILAAFKDAVGDVPLRDIRSEMMSAFVNRGGRSDATRQKKYRVVGGAASLRRHAPSLESVANAASFAAALLVIVHALHLFRSRA